MLPSDALRKSVAAALALLLSSCAATQQFRAAPVPTGEAPPARTILAALEARDAAVATIRAQARLDYESPRHGFRSTQTVVVRSPASARIDVMNPFGISYTVATDGTVLSAYDRRKGVFYRGSAHAENLSRFTGIPMGAPEMAALLRGVPPVLGESRWAAPQAVEGGWLLRRRLAGGGLQEILVEPTAYAPLRVKIAGDRDRHDVEVTFGDYRDVSGLAFPHRIDARFRDGAHLELVYKSVQHGVAIAPDAFRLERPAGARAVDIDTEAEGGV